MSDDEPVAGSPGPQRPAEPQRRPVSHRGEVQRPLLQRLLTPVAAVAVVVVVIVVLVVINGGSPGSHPSPPAVAPGRTSAALTTTPTARTTRPTAGSSAGGSSHPPTAAATHHAAVVPARHRHPSHRPPASAAVAPVTVLNNSRRAGLAHTVAAELAAKGWPIDQIGNLQGMVAQTTLYYPPGERAAAEHLARQFAAVKRLAPAAGGGRSGLTLVVTRYWSS